MCWKDSRIHCISKANLGCYLKKENNNNKIREVEDILLETTLKKKKLQETSWNGWKIPERQIKENFQTTGTKSMENKSKG